MKEILLGSKVQDLVTGYEGIAVSRSTFLQGCTRVGLQAPFNKKEKKLPNVMWFDEPQLKVIGKAKLFGRSKDTTGGPMDGPTRNPDSG